MIYVHLNEKIERGIEDNDSVERVFDFTSELKKVLE